MIRIRREEARLSRVFRRLLLLSLAAPGGIYACNSASDDAKPPADDAGDAALDATSGLDAGSDGGQGRTDASVGDATDARSPTDGGPDATAISACAPSAVYVDDASYVVLDGGPEAGVQPAQHCYSFIDLPCGLPATYQTSACYLDLLACSQLWTGDAAFFDCLVWGAACDDGGVVSPPDASVTVGFGLCNGVGRRPAGLEEPPCGENTASALAAYFARAAHLEAASVDAFLALRDELVARRAPRALVRMAARSARDEVRHARVIGRLARRFGGAPAKVRVARGAARSLEEMARENAVEGCVRETFGAMVATWQAANARDAEVRAAMVQIAVDETRHAALAWAIARWADAQMGDDARARVREARREATRTLAREVSRGTPRSLVTEAGLPTKARAQALVAALGEVLWAA